MTAAVEARYYEMLPERKVRCTLCPHRCRLVDGTLGACGVRVNHAGKLYTLVYDRVAATHLDPIEKKPLYHFLPGTTAYSFSTVGCCLRCSFCQNWGISQWPMEHMPRRVPWQHAGDAPVCEELQLLQAGVAGVSMSPDRIVQSAMACGARSIAYTYVEPTVFFELACDTARLARRNGLRNVFITCGYTCEQPIRELATLMDAVNVDLKFFREESYRHISRGRLQPVLDAIRLYDDLGVWTEVTTLVIPGVNDSDDELRGIARFIRTLSPDIPWHVSRFFPAYRMMDHPVTPVETLARACRIGREAGLRFVYSGNVPGDAGENTVCPGCGRTLITRHGYQVRSNRLIRGTCPDCLAVIPGIEMGRHH
jgi:pyruvate formate lyase activating enzyme